MSEVEIMTIEPEYEPAPLRDPDTGLVYGGGKATLDCPFCEEEITVDFEDGIIERCEHVTGERHGAIVFSRCRS